MARGRIEVSKDALERAIANNPTAFKACQELGLMYSTFIRRCREYGIYAPNQGAKGTRKPNPKAEIPLEKIFSGEHYMTGQGLKRKLLQHGLVKDECSECGIPPVWNNKKLVLQLDHIDGDRLNNSRDNLRLLCPNCHSQTHTFSTGKNRARVAKLVTAPS